MGRHYAGRIAGRAWAPDPSELLGSPAMKALIRAATATNYDMVLIDSPPVLPVTDAAVLGRQVNGALIVAGMDRIHRPQLHDRRWNHWRRPAAPVLGLVINKIARRDVGAYVYERGYYSSEEVTLESPPVNSNGAESDRRHAPLLACDLQVEPLVAHDLVARP